MKKYPIAWLSVIILMTAVSCDKKEDPVPTLQYYLSWVHSDNNTELFEYNSSGEVSAWDYSESTTSIKTTYEYGEGGGAITIKSDEIYNTENRVFREKLYLNQDGTANRAEGTLEIIFTDNGEHLLMMKNYTADFHYSSTRHLEKINVVEKRTDYSGWEEPNGLEWVVELDWKDGYLLSYTEYSNPTRPMVTRTYSYLKEPAVEYAPIVQGPLLRHYYTALQYQGVFGKQSLGLVKEALTAFQTGEQIERIFTYDVAISTSNSWVEGYTQMSGGEEVEYVLAWEKRQLK